MEQALQQAFLATDQEFIRDEDVDHVGTTAVAAVLSSNAIWLANVGDSRAILCRANAAVPATSDHDTTRADEVQRIVAGGGKIRGGNRVLGALPMTRAIGDQRLRPHVIPNPEVTIMQRQAEDQLLVMATDGLWGVVSNARVCEVAMAELAAAEAQGVRGCAAMQRVSNELMMAAINSHTRDNVTIVVVDLRRPAVTEA